MESWMRVAVVTSFPRDCQAPHGGVEAVSVTLVKALARFPDLDLHVVTTHRDQHQVAVETWEGATIHRLPSASRRMLTSVLLHDKNTLREFMTALRPDVIHSHDIYGAMLTERSVPQVFTVHGFIHADTLVSGGAWPKTRSRIWRWVELRGWAAQDRIISISPYVRELVSRSAPAIIHDIDNPVRAEFFDLPRRDPGATVFTASVINKRKNVLALVEAVALLRAEGQTVTLRVAGPVTDDAYGVRVREAIARHNLHDSVILLGAQPVDAIQRELCQASVFALASLEENSPMGIEEAMAAGVPVVTSNRCGMPYMVRDGESGFLVDPLNPRDIADALRVILRNDELRAKMGRVAKATALDRFHPEAVAVRTREVYLQAVRGRGAAEAA